MENILLTKSMLRMCGVVFDGLMPDLQPITPKSEYGAFFKYKIYNDFDVMKFDFCLSRNEMELLFYFNKSEPIYVLYFQDMDEGLIGKPIITLDRLEALYFGLTGEKINYCIVK